MRKFSRGCAAVCALDAVGFCLPPGMLHFALSLPHAFRCSCGAGCREAFAMAARCRSPSHARLPCSTLNFFVQKTNKEKGLALPLPGGISRPLLGLRGSRRHCANFFGVRALFLFFNGLVPGAAVFILERSPPAASRGGFFYILFRV